MQWYKNLIIFIAIFFKAEIFNLDKLFIVILGFISLCLVSSTNYIINDILDKERDQNNPEKRNRPIASGKVGIFSASIISAILFLISLAIAYKLHKYFLLSVISLFVLTLLYSLILKHRPIIDIIVISINFVIRAVSGTFIINTDISPWLITGTFFLSLFVSIGKRISEIKLMKDFENHRITLRFYDGEFSKSLMTASATILIVSFSLYSFLAKHQRIIFTLPVFVYLIFKYLNLVYSNSEIPRHPELIYKDTEFLIGLILMLALSALFVYI
ncbi:MAG: UbiA prenyltransferase family protein [Nanoarchaeota archaeon]